MDELTSESLWDGFVGSLYNPMLPGGSVAGSVLSTIPESTGAAIITSSPGTAYLNFGQDVGTAANGTVNVASAAVAGLPSLVPSKSTIVLVIVLLVVLLLVLGKLEAL